jgi:hypothetical protein
MRIEEMKRKNISKLCNHKIGGNMDDKTTIKEATDPFKNQGTEHLDSWKMRMSMIHEEGFEKWGFMGAW